MTPPEGPKAQEDALMQQLLASVFMSVGAPVAIIATDGKFIAVNPAFTQFLRFESRRLESRNLWDLMAGDGAAVGAASAKHFAKTVAPYELDATMELGDGTTASMHWTMTAVDQPQFKRFRIITLRDAIAPSADAAGDTAPKSTPDEVVVAGKIQLIGLDHVKAALGPRWPAHAERSMTVAEAILRRRLGPNDVFSRTQDQGFVICFAEGSESECAFRAATIAREVRTRLIGEGDDPAGSAVTAITQSIEIDDADREDGQPSLSVLARRLDAARLEAERQARAELSVAMAGATLEPEQLFDSAGKAVPIVFVALAKELQEQIEVALAILPYADGVDADLDVLMLTLAVEAALADIGTGRHGVYLIPLDFALFTNRKRQDRYIEICRKQPEAVRQRVMFVLSDVPKTVSQNRLFDVIRLLKPFGKGVGLGGVEVDFIATDLRQYRIPLFALPAEDMLAAARKSPQKLARFIRQLRLNEARLVVRQVYGEAERNSVMGIGGDLVSFAQSTAVTDVLPQSAGDEEAIRSAAFAEAIKAAPVSCVVTDIRKPEKPIVNVNGAFIEMTGYTAEEAVGRNWQFLQGRDTNRQVVAEISEAAATGKTIRRELLLYRKNGTPFWADTVISPVHNEMGVQIGIVALTTDITALRRAETSQRSLSKFISNLSDTIPGFIFQRTVTPDSRFNYTYVSPSFHRLIGATADEPYSNMPDKWIHPDDLEMVNREVLRSDEEGITLSVEFRLIAKNDQIRWIRSTSRPVRSADGNVVWNGVAVDITSEKSKEGQLSYIAGHDFLTGLLNRHEFRSQLAAHILQVQARSGTFAILAIDIADFQTVNDAFGVVVGDTILKIVGDRIARFDGARLAARVGGNEFVIVLDDIDGAATVLDYARSLRQEIAKLIETHEYRLTTYTYIGLALYPQHVPDLDDDVHRSATILSKVVDVALFAAKGAGPGACVLYAPEDDDRIRNRAILQQSLFEALEKNQFVLHYQPVVELDTGRILGAEALVRWNHPDLGLQRPDRFVPVAEKIGLIVPLGAWIMRQVLQDLREWQERGLGQPRIAVNVAAAQLQHPDAMAEIRAHILDSGFDPTQIEIELTESEFIDPTPDMLGNLKSLRALGVTVAIDDFGTGYSSFRYLRSLPIDKLKIDQTFVRHMTAESGDEAIVRGMIAIGRDLGLSVVVEGVETSEQRDILLGEGCRVGQGYYYSMPVTTEDFAWMLREQTKLPIMRPARQTTGTAVRRSQPGAQNPDVAFPAI
jgi:diguanylate cyclase (GGDEF)-like protein/PAS domain S-box-containing protein